MLSYSLFCLVFFFITLRKLNKKRPICLLVYVKSSQLKKTRNVCVLYSVILSVLYPRKCEYLKDYSLDFEHAYMTTYLASWEACRYFFAAFWQVE